MKSLILAAGYGTRLHPLTENTAKPLLPVAGKPIIEYLLQRILPLSVVDAVYIVTNEKFYQDFLKWNESFNQKREKIHPPIYLLNDGTSSNENRLGAIRDIAMTIETYRLDDDLIVSAADDIFTFDFQELVDTFYTKRETVITLYQCDNIDQLRKSGNARIDTTGRVLEVVEKPKNPKSNLLSPSLYILSRSTLNLINPYLQEGNNPDAPGYFISWLVAKIPVYSYIFKEPFYAVGDLVSYKRIQALFSNSENN